MRGLYVTTEHTQFPTFILSKRLLVTRGPCPHRGGHPQDMALTPRM